jgi:hypothetical protein
MTEDKQQDNSGQQSWRVQEALKPLNMTQVQTGPEFGEKPAAMTPVISVPLEKALTPVAMTPVTSPVQNGQGAAQSQGQGHATQDSLPNTHQQSGKK